MSPYNPRLFIDNKYKKALGLQAIPIFTKLILKDSNEEISTSSSTLYSVTEFLQ